MLLSHNSISNIQVHDIDNGHSMYTHKKAIFSNIPLDILKWLKMKKIWKQFSKIISKWTIQEY